MLLGQTGLLLVAPGFLAWPGLLWREVEKWGKERILGEVIDGAEPMNPFFLIHLACGLGHGLLRVPKV